MDSSNSKEPKIPFVEAVLRTRVAQICDHVGFQAITQDSFSILVDIYQRTIVHLARHCKEAANNNRRVEPTLVDLIQAYDFVGISIPELQEHVENVKLPPKIEIEEEEQKSPVNKIQRDLLVDDLLEKEKNSQIDDPDDVGAENKALSENEEDDKPTVPLLKDAYEEISNQYPAPSIPIKADKKINPAASAARPVKSNEVKQKKEDNKPAIPTLKVIQRDILKQVAKPSTPVKTKKNLKISKKRGRKSEKVEKGKTKIKAKVKVKTKGKLVKGKRGTVKEKISNPAPTEDSEIAKDGDRDEFAATHSRSPSPSERPSKKIKLLVKTPKVTPLDPSFAEPPSFLPILDNVKKEKEPDDLIIDIPSASHFTPSPQPPPQPTIPTPPPLKQVKKEIKKKKKKSSNQFAIVTETVTSAEDKEWFCPACNGPDDGDLMVQCDTCELWYHLRCTNLKKPPKDDENWECAGCIAKKQIIKAPRKRPQTPVEIEPRLKTPELLQEPEPVLPPRPSAPGSSQDDLCPECHLPDDGTLMIQCDDPFCAKWFHGKCVSVLEEPKEDESWFCKLCVEKQQSAFTRRRRAK